ncbi:MAG TPA: AAA family ATPase [Bacteroidales bacterium]|nr:AAA family ATPase [Bacteroidales bacterium]
MVIVGITGTLGAGKGTVVDYLVQHFQFRHFSVRDYLWNEVRARDLPLNRDSLTTVANDLRATHSPSFIVDELYKIASAQPQNAIIESIRTVGEIDSLSKKGTFLLLAVDADPKIRYNRVVLRNSETDHISYETFWANEQREMSSGDVNKQNLGACIQKANYVLLNNGNQDELYRQVNEIINKYL